MDNAEATANALIGLLASMAAVWFLRRAGAWDTAPAWVISAVFFGLSWARSRALRALFRRLG